MPAGVLCEEGGAWAEACGLAWKVRAIRSLDLPRHPFLHTTLPAAGPAQPERLPLRLACHLHAPRASVTCGRLRPLRSPSLHWRAPQPPGVCARGSVLATAGPKAPNARARNGAGGLGALRAWLAEHAERRRARAMLVRSTLHSATRLGNSRQPADTQITFIQLRTTCTSFTVFVQVQY
jgi:hypothetical protein